MTIFTASNQTTLNTALTSAVGGDTINLTAWSGAMTLSGRSYASPGVVIQGARDIVATSVTFTNCTFLSVKGFSVLGPVASTANVNDVFFQGVNPDCSIDSMFIGSSNWESIIDASFFNLTNQYAIFVPIEASAPRLRVVDNTVRGRTNGLIAYAVDGVQVLRNDFDRMGDDVMKFLNTNGGSVRWNLFPRRFYPFNSNPPGSGNNAHGDMIQFQGVVSNFEVSYNVAILLTVQGDGYSGCFFESNGTFTNFTAWQNIITSAGFNALTVGGGGGSVVENNSIFSYMPFNNTVKNASVSTVGSALRNFEATWDAGLATQTRLCADPAGAVGTRIWDKYNIRVGLRNVNAYQYQLEPSDLAPVPGSSADPATNGAATIGAYQTIADMLAGTWPGPTWDGPTPIESGGGGSSALGVAVGGKLLSIGGAIFGIALP